MMKRSFDLIVSVMGLLVLTPLFPVVAALIKLDSSGPVFFRQERVGQGFKPFRIYKFRTMMPDAQSVGGPLTVGEDDRVTRVGRILRRWKIDELPQLINVLRGDMSFVGPRPEMRKYVELYPKDYESLLTIRPGITDLASLKYRNEAEILSQSADPEKEYIERILPEKVALAKQYLAQSSLAFDVVLIIRTLLRIPSSRVSF